MNINKYKLPTSVTVLCLTLAFVVLGQAQSDNQTLILNQPIERQIKGGETHTFQFNVKAGFYARAEVEQKNIDVVVSLFAPDGKLVIEMDGKDGSLWRETVSCIAETGGAYRVDIKAYGAADAVGSYTVKLAEMRFSAPNDRKWLDAEAHLSAGRKFYELSKINSSEAVKEYTSAVALWRELKEEEWEAITLVNLGWTYFYFAKTDLSIAAHEQATELFKKTTDRVGESKSIKWLGVIYYNHLHQYAKAADYFQQTLIIQQEIKDREIGQTFEDLGLIYNKLRQPNIALFYYEKALIIHKEFNDQKKEGSTLYYLGSIYAQIGQYEKAEEYYLRSLSIRKKIKDQRGEFYLYFDLGNLYSRWRKVEKAITFYQYAVSMKRFATAQLVVANLYINLQTLYLEQNNPELSIIYGKQMVNVYQQMRSENYEPLVRIFGDLFNRSRVSLYRRLASTLVSHGRFPEAQAVLDLLKDEEYKQLFRSGEKAETIPYSQSETEVISKIENLVSLERERTELQKLLSTNGELSAEQNDQLAKLNLDIAAANKAFDVALDALGKAEASATTRVDEIKGGKVLQSALTELSEKTNSGVVALYTILGTEEEKDASGNPVKDKQKSKFGWVIMVTENRYTAYPIDVANLEENVFAFRNALSSDKYDPKPLAEKIYKAIFRQTSPKLKKTLEQDLREYLKPYQDKAIMWSLDGVLRYIPMGALHDGKQYLVENYRNTVFTKESFVWLMNAYENNWKALGLGVSDKRENFNALPGVKTELESIVHEPESKSGILNGKIELNDNFKKQTFFNIVNAGAFTVVHISSHYSFDAAKPENSYLLAGDGNLTFKDISEQKNLFKKVDLLTLSACDTGVSGNGKEAEGFAYLAQSLGAKSVIASLWKVSDAGTPELMIRFYKLRAEHPEMSKGEAFREAQISLLDGDKKETKTETDKTNRAEIVGGNASELKLPLFVRDAQKPFAHPHYWSSFVLIGNWR